MVQLKFTKSTGKSVAQDYGTMLRMHEKEKDKEYKALYRSCVIDGGMHFVCERIERRVTMPMGCGRTMQRSAH